MTTTSSTYSYCTTDTIGNSCAQYCCAANMVHSQTTTLCAPQVLCTNSQSYSSTTQSYSCNYDSYSNKCAQSCCLRSTDASGYALSLCAPQSVCSGNYSSYGIGTFAAASTNQALQSALIGVSVSLSIVIVFLLIMIFWLCKKKCFLESLLAKSYAKTTNEQIQWSS